MRNLLTLAMLGGAAVAAGWVVASAAAPDLAAGPAAGAGGPIRIGLPRLRCELQAAAEAYAKLHPEVNVIFGDEPSKSRREFLAGRLDVLGYESDLFYQDQASSDELQEYGKTHSKPPKELTVAYWPYAVAVHPTNPMKAITVAQLRQLFFNPEARWPHLGRSTDGRIRLYVFDDRLIAQALAASESEPASPPTSDSLSKEDAQLLYGAMQKHRVRMGMLFAREFFQAMADDEDGIMVWRHNKELAASGLKVLPIVCTPGQPGALPTDAAAAGVVDNDGLHGEAARPGRQRVQARGQFAPAVERDDDDR